MLQFLYAVISKRSSDSSTDQGETTSVGRRFAAGHLQNTVGLGDKRWGNNKHFILFILYDACEEPERPQVS